MSVSPQRWRKGRHQLWCQCHINGGKRTASCSARVTGIVAAKSVRGRGVVIDTSVTDISGGVLITAVNVPHNTKESFLLPSPRLMSALLMLPLKPKLNVIVAATYCCQWQQWKGFYYWCLYSELSATSQKAWFGHACGNASLPYRLVWEGKIVVVQRWEDAA